ncbi:hypothetical protein BJ508DRAFT_29309 [Ascobolus immersus RN42]|uniref:Uncharacterized protein n=1 Tax=Ascobolus immersus RN42 TaxID=1160509 RepID=A0A3N4HPD9_ASCIM|nr:hypothetical protein BJ508DRAFT_29309 [Ascobolus immersus RN42]
MPKKLPRPSKTDRYEPFKLPATEKPHRRGTVPLQLPPEDYETANARTFQQATGLRSPHPLSSSASRDRKRDEGSRRALQGSERTGIQRRIELEAAQAPPRRRIKYSPSGPFVSRKLSRPDHTHGAHVETEEYMDDIDNDDGFIGQQKHTTARETSTSRKRTLQGTQQHHQKRPADYENESEEVYADLDRGNETSPPSSPPPRTRRRSTSKPITQMTPVSAGVHQPQIQNSAMPDTRLYSSSYSDDSWKGFADEQDGNVSNSSIGLDIDAEDNIYDICSQPGHDHGSRGEDTESEDDEDLDDRGALADRLAELSNLLPSDHDDIELDPVIDGDDEMDENDMDRIRASLEEEEMFYEDSPEFRTLREEFEDPDAGNSSDPEDPPDSRESIHFFRITKAGITLQDLSTISYGSIRIEHRLSKSADKDLRLFYASVAGSVTDGALQPGEIRRARDTLSDITGLAVTRYGRCPDNCVAYDPDDTVTDRCPIEKCGLPRFKTDKTGKRVNAAEYGFISATHRIRALLSDHSKAELMYKYRSDAVERTRKENKVVDIWSGKIFQKLCKQGE